MQDRGLDSPEDAFRRFHSSASSGQLEEPGTSSNGGDGKPLELTYAQILEAWREDDHFYDMTFPYNVIARPIGQIKRPPGEARRIGERLDVEEMLCFMRCLDGADQGSVSLEHFREAMQVEPGTSWPRMAISRSSSGLLSGTASKVSSPVGARARGVARPSSSDAP